MRSSGIMAAIFASLLLILVGFTSGAEVASGEEPPVNRKFYARLGDREYLSPHLSGLRELAVTYLPKSLRLLNIIEAYREITNSIRYELIMATVDSDNTEIVCQMVVKKRPWMQFHLEQHHWRPEKTNCSAYYDGETVDEGGFNDAEPPSGHDHTSEADIADVESHIIPHDQHPNQPNPDYREKGNTGDNYDKTINNFDKNSDSDESTEQPNNLTDKNKSFLDQFFNMEGEKRDIRDVTSSNWNEHFHTEIRRKRELYAEESDESDFLLEDQTEDEVKRTEAARRHFEYFLKEIIEDIPIGNDNYRIDSVIKPKLRMNALVIFKAKLKLKNATGDVKQCSVYIEKISDEYAELIITCPEEKQKRIELDQYNNLKNLIFGSPRLLDYTEYLFKKFRQMYDKQYSLEEFSNRFEIFRRNVFKIELLKSTEQGTGKYGITEFADMTEEEYRQRTGLLYERSRSENAIGNLEAAIPDIELPKHFDWRDKGVVSRVKNQQSCGSCWAFSVTGNIESLHAIRTGKLEEYSEQELLDCDTFDQACGGGLPDDAFKAIEQIGGLELENEYPYKAKQGTCHFERNLVHVKIHGAVDLPKNETAIALYLVENGPISIGINANGMQFYRGGVSHPWRFLCRHSSLDHGVLIVGFGVSEYPIFNKTMPYWIIKNSWDKSWGEQGYYRIFRGDNSCGVSEMASSAVL